MSESQLIEHGVIIVVTEGVQLSGRPILSRPWLLLEKSDPEMWGSVCSEADSLACKVTVFFVKCPLQLPFSWLWPLI